MTTDSSILFWGLVLPDLDLLPPELQRGQRLYLPSFTVSALDGLRDYNSDLAQLARLRLENYFKCFKPVIFIESAIYWVIDSSPVSDLIFSPLKINAQKFYPAASREIIQISRFNSKTDRLRIREYCQSSESISSDQLKQLSDCLAISFDELSALD